jgi:hypothetical protein
MIARGNPRAVTGISSCNFFRLEPRGIDSIQGDDYFQDYSGTFPKRVSSVNFYSKETRLCVSSTRL